MENRHHRIHHHRNLNTETFEDLDSIHEVPDTALSIFTIQNASSVTKSQDKMIPVVNPEPGNPGLSFSQERQGVVARMPRTPLSSSDRSNIQNTHLKPRVIKRLPRSTSSKAPAVINSRDKIMPVERAVNSRISEVSSLQASYKGSGIPRRSLNASPGASLSFSQEAKSQNGIPFYHIDRATDDNSAPRTGAAACKVSSTSGNTAWSCQGLLEAIDVVRDDPLHQRFSGTSPTGVPSASVSKEFAGMITAVAVGPPSSTNSAALVSAKQPKLYVSARPVAPLPCFNKAMKPGTSQDMDSSRFDTRDSSPSRALRFDSAIKTVPDCIPTITVEESPAVLGGNIMGSSSTNGSVAFSAWEERMDLERSIGKWGPNIKPRAAPCPSTRPAAYLHFARSQLSNQLALSTDRPLLPLGPPADGILSSEGSAARPGSETALADKTNLAHALGSGLSRIPSAPDIDAPAKHAISRTGWLPSKPSPLRHMSKPFVCSESLSDSADGVPSSRAVSDLSRVPRSIKRLPKSSLSLRVNGAKTPAVPDIDSLAKGFRTVPAALHLNESLEEGQPAGESLRYALHLETIVNLIRDKQVNGVRGFEAGLHGITPKIAI